MGLAGDNTIGEIIVLQGIYRHNLWAMKLNRLGTVEAFTMCHKNKFIGHTFTFKCSTIG